MKFTPKQEEELQYAFEILPAGEYDFQIISATDKKSKAGNDMIELEIDCFANDGRAVRVFDYLIEIPSFEYKIRHCAAATGLLQEYEKGELTADMFSSRSGRCVLGIKKDKKGEYPDRNEVKDYVKPEDTQRQPGDEDVPEFLK